MKGLYLSEEGEQSLKAEIDKLKNRLQKIDLINNPATYDRVTTQLVLYKRILSSAVILPTYSDWGEVAFYPPDNESQNEKTLSLINGVIIKK